MLGLSPYAKALGRTLVIIVLFGVIAYIVGRAYQSVRDSLRPPKIIKAPSRLEILPLDFDKKAEIQVSDRARPHQPFVRFSPDFSTCTFSAPTGTRVIYSNVRPVISRDGNKWKIVIKGE